MGQILHGSARTTEALRRAIKHSQASIRALEHIRAFPIPGGDSQIAQTVPVLFSLGMEGDHGAGLQPGFA